MVKSISIPLARWVIRADETQWPEFLVGAVLCLIFVLSTPIWLPLVLVMLGWWKIASIAEEHLKVEEI
jgi:hypothetical protein